MILSERLPEPIQKPYIFIRRFLFKHYIMRTDQHKLAQQFQRPSGFAGRIMKAFLIAKNRVLYDWILELLEVAPDDHLLEVGFGPGVAIEKASRIAVRGRVAGVDFSDLMMKSAAKRNAKAIREGRVELNHCDLYDLEYGPDSFDKIYAINVIYFWADPVRRLEKCASMMKPGGRIAVHATASDDIGQYGFSRTGVFNLYTNEEMVQLLRDAGFRNARLYSRQIHPHEFGVCAVGEK